MILPNRWGKRAALATCIVLAGCMAPSQDTPLNGVDVANGAAITTDQADRVTTITPADGPSWTITTVAEQILVSPDGAAVLALHGGPYVAPEMRGFTIFLATAYYRDGDSFTFRHIGPSSFALDRSRFKAEQGRERWLANLRETDTGWLLEAVNGRQTTVLFDQ